MYNYTYRICIYDDDDDGYFINPKGNLNIHKERCDRLPRSGAREQLGVRCLAQGHLGSSAGGELAPLQPPVHAPYCGPCGT